LRKKLTTKKRMGGPRRLSPLVTRGYRKYFKYKLPMVKKGQWTLLLAA